MRKLLTTLAALAAFTLLLPTAGQAQEPPPGDDLLGIYTAMDFTGTIDDHLMGVTPGQVQTHLILTGMTLPTVTSIEFQVGMEPAGALVLVSVQWVSNFFDAHPDPLDFVGSFNVTPVEPEPGTNYAYLGTMNWFVSSTDPVTLFLNQPNIPSPLFEGFMSYLSGDDMAPIRPSSRDFAQPVFGFNTDVVVSAQPTTWSNVKDLYR